MVMFGSLEYRCTGVQVSRFSSRYIYLFNNGIGVTVYQTFLDLVPFLIVIFLLKPRYGGLLRTKMTHLKLKNE